MAINHIEFKASELLQDRTVTVTVSGMTSFRIRVWLGLGLLRLATKVIGIQTEIRNEADR